MSRKYSRAEKEKWTETPRSPPKKGPIVIPESNNEALIEKNRLTLIGRVTNPRFQRTRAIIEIMPQIWNLEGRVEGRDLGPELFQFHFESEEDLLSVLAKGPYHHKRWMLILQRWEPIVSQTFPSQISFWIRIHGIPLHYWTDGALYSIGKSLGHVGTRDVNDARIRVDLNGLLPLEMKSEILLPSGETTEVEFEYIKMEKHCFTCFSLSHEEDDCPLKRPGDPPAKERKLGITQALALERIEAGKRRHDERRGYRPPPPPPPPPHHSPPRRETSRTSKHTDHQSSSRNAPRALPQQYGNLSSAHRGSMEYVRRPISLASQRSETPRRREDHRNARDHMPHYRRQDVNGKPTSHYSGSVSSRYQRTPQRENFSPTQLQARSSPRLAGSRSSHTPPPAPPREPMLITTASVNVSESSGTRERRPALERVAAPDLRDQLIRRSSLSNQPARLQDTVTPPREIITHISTPKDLSPLVPDRFDTELEPSRAPASQRLGGLATLGSREKTRLITGNPGEPVSAAEMEIASAKPAAKRRTTKSSTNKRIARSPMGLNLKKAIIARTSVPPRKRTCTEKGRSLPWNKAGPSGTSTAPGDPKTTRDSKRNEAGSDFRPPLPPLP
ncbi:hypothetical protein Bca101_059110 [Brassica carinata]